MAYQVHNFESKSRLYASQLNEMDEAILANYTAINGGNSVQTVIVNADVSYYEYNGSSNYFVNYTDGKFYIRSGCKASNLIAIPDGVDTVTIKGIGDVNATGYCFYTRNNISYPIVGSGASLKGTDVQIVSVTVPTDAKYVAFTTMVGYEPQSGVSWEQTIEAKTDGILDKVGSLPAYYEDEIKRVGGKIVDAIGYDDIVFGVYTDIHYDNDYNAAYAPNNREVKAMRQLADRYPLDLTIDGGDLLTYCAYDFSKQQINDDMNAFSGCRVPHLIAKGDHDSAQKDTLIGKHEWAARTYPYMPNIVRCEVEPNNYYYDIPNKKTRFVVIDTGTAMAGQSGEDLAMNMEAVYTWMLNDAFTDDVKDGWKFVIFSHAPHDWEWNVGMVKRGGMSGVRRSQTILIDILDALNSAQHYHQDAATSQSQVTVYRGLNGVLTSDTSAPSETYIIGRFNSTLDKDFTGWTSKVLLLCGGHTHCDRLNKVTNGLTKSYAIAYTGGAQYNAYRADDEAYYTTCFGDEGACATWSNLKNRTVGNISEALMDVYHIKGNHIYVYRFGAGDDRHIELT